MTCLVKAGRRAVSFEINDDNVGQDILSNAGFANAIYHTLRAAVGSGAHHAPVCSSWIWMSSSLSLSKSGTGFALYFDTFNKTTIHSRKSLVEVRQLYPPISPK